MQNAMILLGKRLRRRADLRVNREQLPRSTLAVGWPRSFCATASKRFAACAAPIGVPQWSKAMSKASPRKQRRSTDALTWRLRSGNCPSSAARC